MGLVGNCNVVVLYVLVSVCGCSCCMWLIMFDGIVYMCLFICISSICVMVVVSGRWMVKCVLIFGVVCNEIWLFRVMVLVCIMFMFMLWLVSLDIWFVVEKFGVKIILVRCVLLVFLLGVRSWCFSVWV